MLTKQQMLGALDSLISDGNELYKQFLRDLVPWLGTFAAWLKACESTIEAIYGSGSDALRSFRAIYFFPPPNQTYPNETERQKANLIWFESGLRYSITTLIGYRYSIERLLPNEPQRPNPYVFISHGGPTRTHVDAVKDLLAAIGLAPIVVKDMPNLSFSLNEKIRFYMGMCASAVVLATVEDETIAAEKRTRPNVENEVGLLQNASNVGNRIVYLKEPAVRFASNYEEKVWIPFQKDRVQDAFTPLLKELWAFGLLGRSQ